MCTHVTEKQTLKCQEMTPELVCYKVLSGASPDRFHQRWGSIEPHFF